MRASELPLGWLVASQLGIGSSSRPVGRAASFRRAARRNDMFAQGIEKPPTKAGGIVRKLKPIRTWSCLRFSAQLQDSHATHSEQRAQLEENWLGDGSGRG